MSDRKHPAPKLSPEEVVEVYLSRDSANKLSKRYSVSPSTITNIKNDRARTDITVKYREKAPARRVRTRTKGELFPEDKSEIAASDDSVESLSEKHSVSVARILAIRCGYVRTLNSLLNSSEGG